MTKRILTGLAVAFLVSSANAWAQAAIPECRAALQTLQQAGLLQSVGTLVTNSCPNIYGGVWLSGTGVARKDATVCDTAWSQVNASPATATAGKEFVTRNCPNTYTGLGWRTGPAASPGIPACTQAVADLNALGKAVQAGNALKNHCQQLFANGWLVPLGGATNACDVIWTGLTGANALAPARELITHNCPWLYNNGYAVPGYVAP